MKKKKHKKQEIKKNNIAIIGSDPVVGTASQLLKSIHHKHLAELKIKEKNQPEIREDVFLPDSNIEDLIKAGKANTENQINKLKDSETK